MINTYFHLLSGVEVTNDPRHSRQHTFIFQLLAIFYIENS